MHCIYCILLNSISKQKCDDYLGENHFVNFLNICVNTIFGDLEKLANIMSLTLPLLESFPLAALWTGVSGAIAYIAYIAYIPNVLMSQERASARAEIIQNVTTGKRESSAIHEKPRTIRLFNFSIWKFMKCYVV